MPAPTAYFDVSCVLFGLADLSLANKYPRYTHDWNEGLHTAVPSQSDAIIAQNARQPNHFCSRFFGGTS